jgi:MOSC domain-containing protein YiiM
MPVIDSESQGDAATFLTLPVLEARLAALPAAPRTGGRVVSLVSRQDGGRRVLLDRATMTPEAGIPGDRWGRGSRPNPEAQLTVMQRDVAELIANGQPLELFGDNVVLDLDLSNENLPTGSRLRAGGVTLEVTALPHNGCKKFRARFGPDALRLVSDQAIRHRNLRGVYMKVVESGEIAPGDTVTVISRGAWPRA